MLGMELVFYKYYLVLSTVQWDEYFCSTFIDEETEAGRSLLQVRVRAGADTVDYYLVQKLFLLTTMPSKAEDTDADISIPD